MRALRLTIILLILINTGSCIRNYVPNIGDYEEVLVVEGLITDQPGINSIRISKSQPLWKNISPKPLTGCIVTISDDLGKIYNVKETASFGIYTTDQASFRGVTGREYTLHIRTTTETVNLSYVSLPMKMIPVPPIDSLYYEKKTFIQTVPPSVGCEIYLNTHDPSNNCRFYRWEYSETWEFHLIFNVPNKICWITTNPAEILIKNASLHNETNIIKNPVISIKDPVDRLSEKYSILVNQFSLTEDEYFYWEKLNKTIDQTGGLYDLIPAPIPNNIYCIEEPDKKVLGYFSVSAVTSKRLFIKDNFTGVNMYGRCLSDTVFTNRPDTLVDVWIVKDHSRTKPYYVVYTVDRSCVDCTTRGTNIKPVFWEDDKQ